MKCTETSQYYFDFLHNYCFFSGKYLLEVSGYSLLILTGVLQFKYHSTIQGEDRFSLGISFCSTVSFYFASHHLANSKR